MPPRKPKTPAPGALPGSPPPDQAPQLCSLVREPPTDPQWFSEVKFDGYRFLAWKTAKGVRIITRNGKDWTDRLPAFARSIAALRPAVAVLDGELVAVRPDGVSSFPDLQAALSAGADRGLIFYAFDLLALDGWDLRGCILLERKRLLRGVDTWEGQLRYSDHHQGDVPAIFAQAARLGLEGIVCKRDAPYRAGRTGDWIKVKCLGRDELVVLGWTPPAGSRRGIGSLHVGYYDPGGKLHYAGGVGTGFSDQALADWRAKLEPLAAPPPAELLFAGDPLDPHIHWVKPELVVEVAYTAWSGAGRVRHPVYLGQREDKAALEVVRDVADPEARRAAFKPRRSTLTTPAPSPGNRGWSGAIPPRQRGP